MSWGGAGALGFRSGLVMHPSGRWVADAFPMKAVLYLQSLDQRRVADIKKLVTDMQESEVKPEIQDGDSGLHRESSVFLSS